MFASLPLWLLLGLITCLLVIVVLAGIFLFGTIFKLVVALGEARKPPHRDAGDYRLEQGREVRSSEDEIVRRQ